MQHAAPLAKLIDALRALPGVGPKTAQRMAFHLLQGGRGGARALADALTAGLASIKRCQRCRMLTDTRAVFDLRGAVARRRAAVRGRIAGGRGGRRAIRQLSRPLLRAARASVAARWHRAGADRRARVRGAARFGRSARGDPRHESHGGRRGHRAFPRRTRGRSEASRRAASRTACRSAASSSTSMAARWRTRFAGRHFRLKERRERTRSAPLAS